MTIDPFELIAGKSATPADLAEMAKQVDLTTLPDAMRMEFVTINWNYMQADDQTVYLVFYLPIMPFIKFSIPFNRLSIARFLESTRFAHAALWEGMTDARNTEEQTPADVQDSPTA
jgi:hypothetical protein